MVTLVCNVPIGAVNVAHGVRCPGTLDSSVNVPGATRRGISLLRPTCQVPPELSRSTSRKNPEMGSPASFNIVVMTVALGSDASEISMFVLPWMENSRLDP